MVKMAQKEMRFMLTTTLGFVEVVSNNWNEKGGQGTLKGPRRAPEFHIVVAGQKVLPLLLFWEKVEERRRKFLPFFTNLSICSPARAWQYMA